MIPTIPQPFDPNETRSFTFDMSDALADGQTFDITTVTAAVDPRDAATGVAVVQVTDNPSRSPYMSAGIVKFWLHVPDEAQRARLDHVTVRVMCTAETLAPPTDIIQRSVRVKVMQL